jgi:hypothetical protein
VTADRVVVLDGAGDEVGTWPRSEVAVRRLSSGPPVSFVVDVPGSSQLLAAAAGPHVEVALTALA